MLLLFIISLIIIVGAIKVYLKLTTGIVKCSKHLVGKIVIITGGNAGIGYETAKDLAFRGAKIIIACRSEARGTAARDDIIAATENQDVHYRNLDLASLTSVRKFAEEIIKTEKHLDILINNAGVVEESNVKTADGLSLGMQINHFGPFLLTNLLLPLLRASAPSRIINTSSIAYRSGKIDFDNLNMEKETGESFNFLKLYSNTKIANIYMTTELKRVLQGTGVTANALHPGVVGTTIVDEIQKPWMKYIYNPLFKFFSKNVWEGAQTTIYLAVSPDVKEVSGKYYADCKEEKLTELARDSQIARRLWEVSEQAVQLK